jgi:hypothetical protein
LVRDSDGRDVMRGHIVGLQDFSGDSTLRLPNFSGVVLDQARLWVVLSEFFGSDTENVASTIKQDRTRTGRALIQRQNVFQRMLSCLLF